MRASTLEQKTQDIFTKAKNQLEEERTLFVEDMSMADIAGMAAIAGVTVPFMAGMVKTAWNTGKGMYKIGKIAKQAGVKLSKKMTGEGYKVLPNIDKERYTEMPGLEGPFQTMSGKPIYYDPKEGAYYDRDTDMYLTYDEFKALDEGKKKNKNPMGPQGIAVGDRVEHEGDMYQVVAVDGDILTVDNLQNGNRTQFRMDDVTPLFGADAMTDQDEEDLEAMFKRLDKTPSGSLKHVATEADELNIGAKGDRPYKAPRQPKRGDPINPKHKGVDPKVLNMFLTNGMNEGDGRKKGIHPKGHPMRKKQQAAIHAGESKLQDMRKALELSESVDTNTVVAEYTRATLDLRHNTWKKVCEQIDHIRSFVKEDVDVENVRLQIRKMHERENLDYKILVKENVDKLRQIVKDKSAMSIKFADGSMKVDMTTASIFLQVFDKVKEETQAKIIDRIQTKSGFLSVLDKMYSMIG